MGCVCLYSVYLNMHVQYSTYVHVQYSTYVHVQYSTYVHVQYSTNVHIQYSTYVHIQYSTYVHVQYSTYPAPIHRICTVMTMKEVEMISWLHVIVYGFLSLMTWVLY